MIIWNHCSLCKQQQNTIKIRIINLNPSQEWVEKVYKFRIWAWNIIQNIILEILILISMYIFYQ